MNILEIPRKISETFWNSDIWLPPNVTWKDISPNSDINHTNSTHLIIYPLPMALVLFILRRLLEKYCFSPLGISLGLKNTKPKIPPANVHLEKSFNQSKRPSNSVIQGLAKQLDWSTIQVEHWFRTRRQQNKPSTLVKFSECGWRCLYYTISFIYGCIILWDTEWLWEIQKCWKNYPHQSVSTTIWWYYMLNLSFYWSLCFTQFVDVRRSDFWQMFAHHVATIALMSFSWVCNFTRIGSLVILVHDCADFLLEGAKMARYANYKRLCDAIVVVFVPVWVATRNGLFPFWIMKNTLFGAPKIIDVFPAYYIFNSLLFGLLTLHIFWTYLIVKNVQDTLKKGTMEKDVRSGSELDDDDDD